jgi:hypothetical protein
MERRRKSLCSFTIDDSRHFVDPEDRAFCTIGQGGRHSDSPARPDPPRRTVHRDQGK